MCFIIVLNKYSKRENRLEKHDTYNNEDKHTQNQFFKCKIYISRII